MKVAVFGDVHGNLPALEAVLKDIQRRRLEALWNLGDLVGYGPYPDEVVQRLKREKVVNIAGNYDLRVLRWNPAESPRKEEPVDKWIASAWTRENLSRASLAFLGSLPPERRWSRGGHTVLLTHGSPASNTERLEPSTPLKRLQDLAVLGNADVILCSHSHIPWARQVDDVWFVNPGGVGRSDDGDSRASYAVVEIEDDRVRVAHHRIAYDVKDVADAIRRRGLPEAYARMLIESKNLDAVRKTGRAHHSRSDARDARTLENVLGLARQYRYEIGHAHQVTRLSMDLFDALRPLHRLSASRRRWLLYAAILHDIGWVKGPRDHHKASLELIDSVRKLGLPNRERRIVACVARYHRGAHPKRRHPLFGSLTDRDRRDVSVLAAILRVADGLDRTHEHVVGRISAAITPQQIRIDCEVHGPSDEERRFALTKGRLLEEMFDRTLVIACRRR
jgi:putative phosphoesterase